MYHVDAQLSGGDEVNLTFSTIEEAKAAYKALRSVEATQFASLSYNDQTISNTCLSY